MSKVNRPPLGLQQLLGSQNFGSNPTELSNTVSPVIDLFGFLGAPLLEGRETVGTRANEGLITQIVFDKRVALINASMSLQWTGANGTYGIGIDLSGVPGTDPTDGHWIAANGGSVAGNQIIQAHHTFDRPIILEKGAVLGYWFTKITLNVDNMTCRALYYDLDPGAV